MCDDKKNSRSNNSKQLELPNLTTPLVPPVPPVPPAAPAGRRGGGGDGNLRASFTTRKGNTFYAKDYGYKAWPIGGRS